MNKNNSSLKITHMQDANLYSLRDPPHPHQTDCVLDNDSKSPPRLPQPFSTLILVLGTLNVRGLRSKVEDVIYCKSRIFRMHFIFVYFVRGGFRTKI